MKPLIRLFFKTLRLILGPFLLLGHWLSRPKGVVRPPEAQRAVDARTRKLALYHFPTCPFCLKTRRTMRRLSLDIELRDARTEGSHRTALVAGGGKPQVPCLRIRDDDGRETWLYESDAINAWLEREFGTA
ncbi:glutaredoxin family protein [Thiobacillus denitrificans ATCC 25259]|uniref:Glutaredoxin family protein n=1 Tax=Thiobacillus denitrificans (strain ATCC 25259 / T1) TaxID=292415 RepID=Q3SMC7_THIDA|nr:glutaredoxin [Thiobacillus denitrificans]AAZ96120.1 glutaredoxin family protein [Thiobacillus denitrificans ATCC 25259]